MTSSVKFTAHCSGSKRLYVCTTHVDHTGTQRKEEHWLKDGESMEVTVYDSKRTHAFEVDASQVPADYDPPNRPHALESTELKPLTGDPAKDQVFQNYDTPGVGAGAPSMGDNGGEFGGAGASGDWGNKPAPGFDAAPVDSAAGD